MCGIAGYFGPQGLPTDRLKECKEQLRLRGPDNSGLYENHEEIHVGLVHTRLSILDLDARSAQPFRYGKYIFSYNGEIYNYIEIRKELQSLGYKFKTEGDTEVLAAAWAQWGKEALNRFDGMWAFAVFDESTSVLTLATDPFGEKPLYLLRKNDGAVYFSSQINCLMTMDSSKRHPNWQHLKRFLANGYKALHKYHETFVQDVFRVPGNQIIKISKNGISQAPYWQHPIYQPDEHIKRSVLVERTRETLIESVQKRMRSDVPLAFCMSGGVDSNSIIAIAAKKLGLDVRGFTIMNQDGRYDERELVDLCCNKLGIKNEKIALEPENFLDSLRSMVDARSGPVSTISYYTQNYLHKAISEHGYKVAISGTAADELFSGYYDHHLLYLAAQFPDKESRAKAVLNWETYIKPITRNPLLQDPNMYINKPSFRDHIYYKNTEYAGFFKDFWYESFQESVYSSSLMRNRMMNEMFHEAVPVILTEDDANAMSYSVENRSPFLSRELLEVSLSIPDHQLIKNGYTKSILRESMQGLVPDEILWERKKVGFNSSLFEIANIKSDEIRSFLLDSSSFYDIIKRDKVESFLSRDLNENSDSKFLFNLINAKMTVDMME